MIFTESTHRRRGALKTCCLMIHDDIGKCMYRKKIIGYREQHPAGMSLKMSLPLHESMVEQEEMVPGGLRDLIIDMFMG